MLRRLRPSVLALGGLGIVLILALVIWLVAANRGEGPVRYDVLKGDVMSFNDGSWDHFQAVAVNRRTSREDLQRLLDQLQEMYVESEFDRVKIIVFNDRLALLNANEDALVAEYLQDRGKGQFDKVLLMD